MSKSDLAELLSATTVVIPARTTYPILSNVLVDASADGITLTATDLDILVRAAGKAEVLEVGRTTLHGKTLDALVKELPDGDIELKTAEGGATVDARRGHYKLSTQSAEDYPSLDTRLEGAATFQMPTGQIKEMLGRVRYAAALDDTRVVLNGVLFKVRDSQLTLVSTDSHRLAGTTESLPTSTGVRGDWIVPSRSMDSLVRTLARSDTATISLTEKQLRVDCGAQTLVTRLIDGTYPDYEQVVPRNNQNKLRFERGEILAALKRSLIFASVHSRLVRFKIEAGELEVVAVGVEQGGESREPVTCDFQGEPMEIGFNGSYMTDILKQFESEQIELSIGTPTSAVRISPVPAPVAPQENYAVLMPLRL